MLPYFRNYAFLGYVLGMAIPVLLVTALSWIVGFYVVYTLPGLISAIVLLVLGLLTAKKVVTRMADRKADEMISLYNDSCDPEAFLASAASVAREIRPPYDPAGSWFLSYYALALDDTGKRSEAVHIGQAMLSSAQMAMEPKDKAALLVNIIPLVQRLFGAEQALEVVVEAQNVLAGSTDPDDVNRLSYLKFERGILEAVRDGDDQTLIRQFSGVRTTESYPMRMRVSDALLEASIHKAKKDESRERECLNFIVLHGNKLPAVSLAQQRLQDLNAAS